jgi:hypothetical protein
MQRSDAILSLGAFKKVKLYEARDFFEMTVAARVNGYRARFHKVALSKIRL